MLQPQSHALRNIINKLGRSVGLLEQQVQQTKFHPDYFDIGELPIHDVKAAPGLRDPTSLTVIVAHITAVDGGFGVSKQLRQRWEAVGAMGIAKQFPFLWEQLNDAGVDASPEDHADLMARIATWSRYRDTPYHQIASTFTGDVLANRDLSQRSYHGNDGNVGVGFAMDQGSADGPKMTDDMVATAQAGLRALVFRLRSVGNADRKLIVVPHRSFSKDRRVDPGQHPWQRVVIPVVDGDSRLVIGYNTAADGGLPVPKSWDPNALYDDKGKRIA